MFRPARTSDEEERQFVELTSRLIDQVDDATRAAVRARLAIYPGTPVEILRKLGLKPGRTRSHPPAASRRAGSPPVVAADGSRPNEPSHTAANLAMQPQDAADISEMFFSASVQRTRADPAQSGGHAAEGLAANSRRRAPRVRSRRWRWPRSPPTSRTSRWNSARP